MKKLILTALAISLFACSKDDNAQETQQANVTLTSLSTNSGNANTNVTITGTGFSTTATNNTVKFGDIVAEVTAATSTTLTVKVPNNSTKGKVSVAVGSKTAVSSNDFTTTSFIDTRDSQEYGQVYIGNQLWMTRNLNYELPSDDYCYDNNSANCDQYGKLYTHSAALLAVPAGWHLPSETEINSLITTLGGATTAKTALAGTNSSSGFNALYAGMRSITTGTYGKLGQYAIFWSSTNVGTSDAQTLFIDINSSDVVVSASGKAGARSVRCIKN